MAMLSIRRAVIPSRSRHLIHVAEVVMTLMSVRTANFLA
jgi:hypothetical protein